MALDEMVAQMVDPNEFVRLVNAVHVDMYPQDFQIVDGTRADNGNDGYVSSERRMIAIYCPVKPEQRRDSDYRTKIESDLDLPPSAVLFIKRKPGVARLVDLGGG